MAIRGNPSRARGDRSTVRTSDPVVADAPESKRLSDIPTGETVVLSAPHAEPQLCRRLAQLGLRPGMSVTVGNRTSGGGRVVRTGTTRYAIDRHTLEQMDVLR